MEKKIITGAEKKIVGLDGKPVESEAARKERMEEEASIKEAQENPVVKLKKQIMEDSAKLAKFLSKSTLSRDDRTSAIRLLIRNFLAMNSFIEALARDMHGIIMQNEMMKSYLVSFNDITITMNRLAVEKGIFTEEELNEKYVLVREENLKKDKETMEKMKQGAPQESSEEVKTEEKVETPKE